MNYEADLWDCRAARDGHYALLLAITHDLRPEGAWARLNGRPPPKLTSEDYSDLRAIMAEKGIRFLPYAEAAEMYGMPLEEFRRQYQWLRQMDYNRASIAKSYTREEWNAKQRARYQNNDEERKRRNEATRRWRQTPAGKASQKASAEKRRAARSTGRGRGRPRKDEKEQQNG